MPFGIYPLVSIALLVHNAVGLVHKNRGNGSVISSTPRAKGLSFIHVPYNFGHTIEKVAAYGNGFQANIHFGVKMLMSFCSRGGELGELTKKAVQAHHLNATRFLHHYGFTHAHLGRRSDHKATLWGALANKMMSKSDKGCPMYLTPPKFWPGDLQEEYFGGPGGTETFGLIRDPLERLVAIFRGSVGGETGDIYGGRYDQWSKSCDVDGAVRAMMKNYIKNRYEDPYSHGCTFVPQSDYIGPRSAYGISLPLDNRRFPINLNELFTEYTLPYEITNSDILHVTGCEETWAGAVGPETRGLVDLVYKEDYDFICKQWGYCTKDENTCLQHVPRMCPRNMTLAAEPLIEFPFGLAIYSPWASRAGASDGVAAPDNGMSAKRIGPGRWGGLPGMGPAGPWAGPLRAIPWKGPPAGAFANSLRAARGYAMYNNPTAPWAAAATRSPRAAPSYQPAPPSYRPMPPWSMAPMHDMMSKALSTNSPRAMHEFSNAFAVNPWAAVPWDDDIMGADDDWQGTGDKMRRHVMS